MKKKYSTRGFYISCLRKKKEFEKPYIQFEKPYIWFEKPAAGLKNRTLV